MIYYVPILKSKPAEIWAWTNLSMTVLTGSRVLFELVPTDTKTAPAINFINRLTKNYPSGQIITLDCGYFDQGSTVVTDISNELHQRNVTERPVFRLSDSPATLGQIRQACTLHGQGACLRLGSDTQDPDPNVSTQVVANTLASVGLTTSQVDLIIDFKVINSTRDVTRCIPLALSLLAWATNCGTWRSVTLASGAFPRTVSGFPTGLATGLDRFDAIFYTQVTQANPSITPDFGDYSINYPILGPTPPRAPNPNLRYTDVLQWQIEREERTLPGNDSFFTLCQRVVQAGYWAGIGYSTGDAEIERCSRSSGSPGTATNWLSFGGSHHMTHVVDRLATLGAP